MTNVTYPGKASESGDIDLVALLMNFWGQKWLILLVTFIVASGAAFYAYTSKPVYQARVTVLPPALSDIAGFNVARGSKSGLPVFKVDDIYDVFVRNLGSEESRRQFFRDVYLPTLSEVQRSGSQDGLYRAFNQMLSVKPPKKNETGHTVTVEGGDPARAAEWVKQYLNQVTGQSLTDMLQNTQREVEIKRKQIRQEINTLRDYAKTRRNDRLVKLKEALAVAEKVGLEKPPVISGSTEQQLSAFMDGDLMYMRGTKALRAEIEALEKRASDDPFIPSLRNLEEQYNYFVELQVSPESVAIFRQDGPVITPDAPIKPRKLMILALGTILGGMLGVFIAMIRLLLANHFNGRREVYDQASQPVLST